MFLKKAIKDNPKLVESAVKLHQEGKIPPNSWIVDLDMIAANASVIAAEAKKYDLKTYFMTKQLNRNPFITHIALSKGIDKTVAVDVMGAKTMHRFGIPIGHVGHLTQVPKHDLRAVLKMKPEMITVYSYEMAEFISEAAVELDMVQDILIKVADEDIYLMPGQESGIMMADLKIVAEKVLKLPGVNIAGVTAFPCLSYNTYGSEDVKPTANFHLLAKAIKLLKDELGVEVKVVNAPGNTSTATMKLLSEMGATHVEPGHGMTGTSPAHIYDQSLPEKAALLYVSEISHHYGDAAYAYGGGLYVCLGGGPKGYPVKALVGSSYEQCLTNQVDWEQVHRDNIDYYAILRPGRECKVGDTVLFGFRAQIFVTRALTAVVSGISTGEPVVEGIFDQACNMVDENYVPVSPEKVMEKIKALLPKYS